MKRRLAPRGKPYKFSDKTLKGAKAAVAKYPEGRQTSAVKEILYLAQDDCEGWLPQEAIQAVSEFLDMPLMRVYEVATFYTMFNLSPVGKHHIQVCTTTPCWLRGSDEVLSACQKKAQEKGDQVFTVSEVECLGACANAPMVQINNDYYEDLDARHIEKVLDDLAAGKKPKVGPQVSRLGSAPEGMDFKVKEGKA